MKRVLCFLLTSAFLLALLEATELLPESAESFNLTYIQVSAFRIGFFPFMLIFNLVSYNHFVFLSRISDVKATRELFLFGRYIN